MLQWWKKKVPLAGFVLFRGDLPLQPEDFAYLINLGITTDQSPNNTKATWLLKLSHPIWGSAEIMYKQDGPLPPREVFQYSFIPNSDKEAAIQARGILAFRMESKHEHILRDRKLMLRFLRALMGSDGVVSLDSLSGKVWTREELDDELSHDADLDVEGIINLHAVSGDDSKIFWIHTHGLGEVGAYDFDILDPSPDILYNISDLCRAIAFGILEGSVGSNQEFSLISHHDRIKLVSMEQFLKNSKPKYRNILDPLMDEEHRRLRYVLCEPEKLSLGSFFNRKTIEPVRLLSGKLPENPVFGFSEASSQLMAERARNTYPMLRKLREEFAGFDFMYGVKLGFDTMEHGKRSKEHIWFELHEMYDDSIDGTLLNQPYAIPGMKEGDHGRHPISLMSDWLIMTPVGMITPRSTTVARMVRADPDGIRRMMEMS